ncbi:unnamed protein product [Ixodes hexagonus]
MFSLRIVTVDHYLAAPVPRLDAGLSRLGGWEVWKVPVIRIFGVTPAGQKACLHVHGVFPYLCVPFDEDVGERADKYAPMLASELDLLLNTAAGKASSRQRHVHHVEIFRGTPIYGFHNKDRTFLKIYLYNPYSVKRVADLLLSGMVLKKVMQPHEAHIPFTLQASFSFFLIDHNLHGMSFVKVEKFKFRRPNSDLDLDSSRVRVRNSRSDELVWVLRDMPSDMFLDMHVQKQTTCELELDCTSEGILTAKDADKGACKHIHVNGSRSCRTFGWNRWQRGGLSVMPVSTSGVEQELRKTGSLLDMNKCRSTQINRFIKRSTQACCGVRKITLGSINPLMPKSASQILDSQDLSLAEMLARATANDSWADLELAQDADSVLSVHRSQQSGTSRQQPAPEDEEEDEEEQTTREMSQVFNLGGECVNTPEPRGHIKDSSRSRSGSSSSSSDSEGDQPYSPSQLDGTDDRDGQPLNPVAVCFLSAGQSGNVAKRSRLSSFTKSTPKAVDATDDPGGGDAAQSSKAQTVDMGTQTSLRPPLLVRQLLRRSRPKKVRHRRKETKLSLSLRRTQRPTSLPDKSSVVSEASGHASPSSERRKRKVPQPLADGQLSSPSAPTVANLTSPTRQQSIPDGLSPSRDGTLTLDDIPKTLNVVKLASVEREPQVVQPVVDMTPLSPGGLMLSEAAGGTEINSSSQVREESARTVVPPRVGEASVPLAVANITRPVVRLKKHDMEMSRPKTESGSKPKKKLLRVSMTGLLKKRGSATPWKEMAARSTNVCVVQLTRLSDEEIAKWTNRRRKDPMSDVFSLPQQAALSDDEEELIVVRKKKRGRRKKDSTAASEARRSGKLMDDAPESEADVSGGEGRRGTKRKSSAASSACQLSVETLYTTSNVEERVQTKQMANQLASSQAPHSLQKSTGESVSKKSTEEARKTVPEKKRKEGVVSGKVKSVERRKEGSDKADEMRAQRKGTTGEGLVDTFECAESQKADSARDGGQESLADGPTASLEVQSHADDSLSNPVEGGSDAMKTTFGEKKAPSDKGTAGKSRNEDVKTKTLLKDASVKHGKDGRHLFKPSVKESVSKDGRESVQDPPGKISDKKQSASAAKQKELKKVSGPAKPDNRKPMADILTAQAEHNVSGTHQHSKGDKEGTKKKKHRKVPESEKRSSSAADKEKSLNAIAQKDAGDLSTDVGKERSSVSGQVDTHGRTKDSTKSSEKDGGKEEKVEDKSRRHKSKDVGKDKKGEPKGHHVKSLSSTVSESGTSKKHRVQKSDKDMTMTKEVDERTTTNEEAQQGERAAPKVLSSVPDNTFVKKPEEGEASNARVPGNVTSPISDGTVEGNLVTAASSAKIALEQPSAVEMQEENPRLEEGQEVEAATLEQEKQLVRNKHPHSQHAKGDTEHSSKTISKRVASETSKKVKKHRSPTRRATVGEKSGTEESGKEKRSTEKCSTVDIFSTSGVVPASNFISSEKKTKDKGLEKLGEAHLSAAKTPAFTEDAASKSETNESGAKPLTGTSGPVQLKQGSVHKKSKLSTDPLKKVSSTEVKSKISSPPAPIVTEPASLSSAGSVPPKSKDDASEGASTRHKRGPAKKPASNAKPLKASKTSAMESQSLGAPKGKGETAKVASTATGDLGSLQQSKETTKSVDEAASAKADTPAQSKLSSHLQGSKSDLKDTGAENPTAMPRKAATPAADEASERPAALELPSQSPQNPSVSASLATASSTSESPIESTVQDAGPAVNSAMAAQPSQNQKKSSSASQNSDVKKKSSKADSLKAPASKSDVPKLDASKLNASKGQASKLGASTMVASNIEASKADTSKAGAPKVYAPKADAPKADAPKANAPKAGASKATNASKQSASKESASKQVALQRGTSKSAASQGGASKINASKTDVPKGKVSKPNTSNANASIPKGASSGDTTTPKNILPPKQLSQDASTSSATASEPETGLLQPSQPGSKLVAPMDDQECFLSLLTDPTPPQNIGIGTSDINADGEEDVDDSDQSDTDDLYGDLEDAGQWITVDEAGDESDNSQELFASLEDASCSSVKSTQGADSGSTEVFGSNGAAEIGRGDSTSTKGQNGPMISAEQGLLGHHGSESAMFSSSEQAQVPKLGDDIGLCNREAPVEDQCPEVSTPKDISACDGDVGKDYGKHSAQNVNTTVSLEPKTSTQNMDAIVTLEPKATDAVSAVESNKPATVEEVSIVNITKNQSHHSEASSSPTRSTLDATCCMDSETVLEKEKSNVAVEDGQRKAIIIAVENIDINGSQDNKIDVPVADASSESEASSSDKSDSMMTGEKSMEEFILRSEESTLKSEGSTLKGEGSVLKCLQNDSEEEEDLLTVGEPAECHVSKGEEEFDDDVAFDGDIGELPDAIEGLLDTTVEAPLPELDVESLLQADRSWSLEAGQNPAEALVGSSSKEPSRQSSESHVSKEDPEQDVDAGLSTMSDQLAEMRCDSNSSDLAFPMVVPEGDGSASGIHSFYMDDSIIGDLTKSTSLVNKQQCQLTSEGLVALVPAVTPPCFKEVAETLNMCDAALVAKSSKKGQGLSYWQRVKLQGFAPNSSFDVDFEQNPELRIAFCRDRTVVLTPARFAPSFKAVQRWAKSQQGASDARAAQKEHKLSLPVLQLNRTNEEDDFDPNFKEDLDFMRHSTPVAKEDECASMRLKGHAVPEKDRRKSRVRLDLSPPASGQSSGCPNVRTSLNLSSASVSPASSPLKLLDFNIKDERPARNAPLNTSTSQLDGPTRSGTFNFGYSGGDLQQAKGTSTSQMLTLLSVEVHVRTRNDLQPDPAHDPVQCIFYCLHNDSQEEDSAATDIVGALSVREVRSAQQGASPLEVGDLEDLVSGSRATPKGCSLLWRSGVTNLKVDEVAGEMDLFDALVTLIRRWDPDILVGYEIQKSSWGYLLERGSYLRLDLASMISRVPKGGDDWHKESGDPEWDAVQDKDIVVTGRVVLNLWRIMRKEVTLNIYTFENVYYHVVHRRVPLYSFKTLTEWFDHDTDLFRWRTVEHYVIRAKGNLELLDRLDIVGKTSEMARIFGIQFFEVLSRGSQFRVESMMLRVARQRGLVSLSPSVQQRARMRAMEFIPLVMEPQSRMYNSPVAVLDFQSLYPSVMIAYNYCFSTCLGRLDHFGSGEPFVFGCSSLTVPVSLLNILREYISVSPAGVAFVQSSVRRGVLPQMLEEILNTRLMVKQSMKECKDDKVLKKVLDARQLGLKLISNVTYGYTAASFSGRMPCVELADSIVSKGRETLERAIKTVEATPRWGGKVIYGDTDSMFVLLHGKTKEQAFQIGQEIAEVVTAQNPKPIKLKFEKVYLPCVLQTKKRYVGFSYESPDQKEPTYDAKGIETVRRDTCPAVSKLLEKSLRLLFGAGELTPVKSYLKVQFSKMLSEQVSLQDFIFAKEFRGLSGYKPGACVPGLEIARRMVRKDPRLEPRVGERVPYVVVYGSPGLRLIQLVRHPLEVLSDPSLRLNVHYYLTRVVAPALNRVLKLLGQDVLQWYGELPRPALGTAGVVRGRGGANSIAQYLVCQLCPACGAQSPREGLCPSCRADPGFATLALGDRVHRVQRALHDIQQICQSCMGFRGSECISTDCPILYKKARVTYEAKQARAWHNANSNAQAKGSTSYR